MSIRTDFPYYNGTPADIAASGWLSILAAVAAAFALLITLPFQHFPLNLLPAIVYTGLPLLVVAVVTRGHQGALFRHFGIKQFALALGFGLLTLIASFSVGLVLSQFISMTANPSAAILSNSGAFDTAIFLVRTFIQLIGEELMTILPLLAVLWLCVRKLNLSRRTGLVVGVIVSTIGFAAVHLPTYDWNFIQCFGGIGTARLVLTTAYLVTRNVWVSAGAHIVNDWTEFFLPTLMQGLGHGPIDAGG